MEARIKSSGFVEFLSLNPRKNYLFRINKFRSESIERTGKQNAAILFATRLRRFPDFPGSKQKLGGGEEHQKGKNLLRVGEYDVESVEKNSSEEVLYARTFGKHVSMPTR